MFFYDQFFGALRMSGGYYQFQAPQLRVMPFKTPSETIDKQVSAAVLKIMELWRDHGEDNSTKFQQKGASLEQEIDRLVYKLYDLTPEEIRLVEEGAQR